MHKNKHYKSRIRALRAPSILGLKPSGVEMLPDALVTPDFVRQMHILLPIIDVPTLNAEYSTDRDRNTGCLNTGPIRDFSKLLSQEVNASLSREEFPIVFGGDCSILLGTMHALRKLGNYGLIFLDAHADFYLPNQSPTGEVADMELSLLTGRGPKELSNMDNLAPYVTEENVIHVGERDFDETRKLGAEDLSKTAIKTYDLPTIRNDGMSNVVHRLAEDIRQGNQNGYWLHFDTDVLSDDINPAVDYRIPGGLSEAEALLVLREIMKTSLVKGMSITIYNPKLDSTGDIGKLISSILVRSLNDL